MARLFFIPKKYEISFKEALSNKKIVIIDCFEFFIERPAPVLTQQQWWLNNKHHSTVKYLIGKTR